MGTETSETDTPTPSRNGSVSARMLQTRMKVVGLQHFAEHPTSSALVATKHQSHTITMLSSATPHPVIELVSMTSYSPSPRVLPQMYFGLGETPPLTPPMSPLFDTSWADTFVPYRQQTQSPRYEDNITYRRRPVGLGISLIGGQKSHEDLTLELMRDNPNASRDEVRRRVVRMTTSERVSRMIEAQKSRFHTMTVPGVPGYEETVALTYPAPKQYSLLARAEMILIHILLWWMIAKICYLLMRL